MLKMASVPAPIQNDAPADNSADPSLDEKSKKKQIRLVRYDITKYKEELEVRKKQEETELRKRHEEKKQQERECQSKQEVTSSDKSKNSLTIMTSNITLPNTDPSTTAASQSSTTTIVDEFFKDFISTKMKEVESEYQKKIQDKPLASEVANSVEEMNKLLDEELERLNTSRGSEPPSQTSEKDMENDKHKSKSKKSKHKSKEKEKKKDDEKDKSKDRSERYSDKKHKDSDRRESDNKHKSDKDYDKRHKTGEKKSRDNDVRRDSDRHDKDHHRKHESERKSHHRDRHDSDKDRDHNDRRRYDDKKGQKSRWDDNRGHSRNDSESRRSKDKKENVSSESKKRKSSEREIVDKKHKSDQDGQMPVGFKRMKTETLIEKSDSEQVSKENNCSEGVGGMEHDLLLPGELAKSSTGNASLSESKNLVIRCDNSSVDRTVFVNEQDGSGVKKPALAFKGFGIKISETSASLIASGVVTEKSKKKKREIEDGEVFSSNDESDDDSSGEESGGAGGDDDDDDDDMDVSETGSISDSDDETKKSKSKKKKKKKHKHKKKKKHKKSKDKESNDKSKHTKSRSRSRSPRRSHHSARSRSRERYNRERDWERDRERYYREYERDFDYDRDNYASDSVRERRCRDYYRRKYGDDRYSDRTRARGRSRSPEDLRLKIDKNKLRQIAIKQALSRAKSGDGGVNAEQLAVLKAGGKSVEELTDFCKRISEKEYILSSSDEDGETKEENKANTDEKLHHPFVMKDVKDIVLNIRNAKQLPTQTPQEKFTQGTQLRLQFPVSSGSQHRTKEMEWVPVEKSTAPATEPTTTSPNTTVAAIKPVTISNANSTVASTPPPAVVTTPVATPAPPPPPPPATVPQPALKKEDKVFPESNSVLPVNISSIVSERLSAVRKLQENPHDVQALNVMYKAQKQANEWIQSKNLPGLFVGSTGAQVLSQQELAGGDKYHQAWFKKDQFAKAAPVKGGIGHFLLQKMGWKEGEGLGKNNEGDTAPLMLNFKIDRKGLTTSEESTKKVAKVPIMRGKIPKDLSGKHPVSALVELCNKRKWGPPHFDMIHESGPDHKKHFLFKVKVNKVEYQPTVASSNKKQAKAQSAACCLIELGLLPRDYVVSQ